METNYVHLKFIAENEVHSLAQTLFQKSISDEEFASLTGARAGDNVLISLKYDMGKPYIELRMTRKMPVSGRAKYQNLGMVSALSEGRDCPLLTIMLIKIPQELQNQGLGSNIIAIQVKAAQRMGIPQIVGYADNKEYLSGRHYVGYYALPRLGFDAHLDSINKRELPAELANKSSLGEIMLDDKLRKLWREKGLPIYVTFETSANSSSMCMLQDYFKEKGWPWEGIPDTPPRVLRVTTFA